METKKIITIAFLLLSNIVFAQSIKLMEHFSYDNKVQMKQKWQMYNLDSSDGGESGSWFFYDKTLLKSPTSTFLPYPNNPNYNMKGRNLDTSGVIVSGNANCTTNRIDDWLVYRNQLNIGPNDTIAFYAGASVNDLNFPWGTGKYKHDTVEVWLSDKQLTTEPSNMNLFVGYAIVKDTFPIWHRFSFPLNGILSQNKLVYMGIRNHLKEICTPYAGPTFWLDDLYVGNNPSRDLATKTEDLLVKTGLKVYPNPVKDKLNIEFKYNAEKGEIKVFNVFGQMVISQNVQVAVNGIHELNVESLTKGIYFLQYGSKNQKTVSSKFVKE